MLPVRVRRSRIFHLNPPGHALDVETSACVNGAFARLPHAASEARPRRLLKRAHWFKNICGSRREVNEIRISDSLPKLSIQKCFEISDIQLDSWSEMAIIENDRKIEKMNKYVKID